MIAPTQRQSLLFFTFFTPLAHQIALLKDDLLDPVDHLLDDDQLVDRVRTCLICRHPNSSRTGRPGIAPDRLLRCCVLKHMKSWSFRELERELRSHLLYRRFTHYDADPTPTIRSSAAPSPCSVPRSPSRCCAGSLASPANRESRRESDFAWTAR